MIKCKSCRSAGLIPEDEITLACHSYSCTLTYKHAIPSPIGEFRGRRKTYDYHKKFLGRKINFKINNVPLRHATSTSVVTINYKTHFYTLLQM